MATVSAHPKSNPNPNFLSPTDQTNHSQESPSQMQHHSSPDPELNSGRNINSNFRTTLSTPPVTVSTAAPLPSLLHLSFNQDHGCFVVGTNHGFRVYNCDPFGELFRRDIDHGGGGIMVVEMLFRSNFSALVFGGPYPQCPPFKVKIWDDSRSRFIGEFSPRSEVRSVRLRRDRIVAVSERKVSVYSFMGLELLHQIETISNPKGLCAVSLGAGSFVLVCPGLQKGQVRVEHYASNRTKFIMAHDSRIACLALTQDGQFLTTASTKGTLVRIFNAVDGSLLQEVRRGADRAEIYSLAFSSNAQWLAVSSDKGTVHVFSLKINAGSPGTDSSQIVSDPVTSPYSSLSFIKGVLPKYFSSEWSVAQFHLVEGLQYIVAFGHQKNTVIILGMDGSFYRCQFDPKNGGEMTQLEYRNFLKPAAAF